MHLFLAAVIGLAFVGLIVGIRQGSPVSHATPRELRDPDDHPDAVPATAYRDFDRRKVGPNADWRSKLSDLKQPDVNLFAPLPPQTAEARKAVIEARAQRRAFDGAPPVVPHPIDQMTTTGCIACHGQGLRIGDRVAAKMSHAFMANCTQCHVEQQSPHLPDLPTADNSFIGLAAPLGGERAWPGAPPTIPHTTRLRENCIACHGPTGPAPIRTTHPWRFNCLQCHAPSAALDQATFDPVPSFIESLVRPADRK